MSIDDNMNNYTAINIGPIGKTIGMARKPRELWAASYIFSFLMKRIIEALPDKNAIVSPSIDEAKMRTDVGLYPDRVYVKGEVKYDDVITKALGVFADELGLDLASVNGYFNVMLCTTEKGNVSEAIKDLNHKLDCLELFNRATDSECEKGIRDLITKKENSPLFRIAFGKSYFHVEELKDIAQHDDKDLSYNNYIAIVQADGDNMGKIISATDEGQLKKVSGALLSFGCDAIDAIRQYSAKSLPIYAGGDDLLFIVPVVGENDKNIFDLISTLDAKYQQVKDVADPLNVKDDEGNTLKTSISYGIAMSYHKYPLYEAFETASNQLFEVAKKQVDGKNALAWDLRKHSGGAFSGAFSKNNTDIYKAFKDIIKVSGNKSEVVSAVSHKIRSP